MKKLLATLLALVMLCGMSGAVAENTDVTGKVIIYTSMYQDICDLMSEALKAEFPNAEIEFFQGGTGTLQTKVAGEMESGKLGCDMLMVAEPAYSLELKEGGWLHPYLTEARNNMRFPYDEEGYWYCVRVCSMGLAYNPEMYTKEEIPTSFEAFAYDTSAAGMISMSNPLTSGTAMATIVGLVDKYGEEYFDALGLGGGAGEASGGARAESGREGGAASPSYEGSGALDGSVKLCLVGTNGMVLEAAYYPRIGFISRHRVSAEFASALAEWTGAPG